MSLKNKANQNSQHFVPFLLFQVSTAYTKVIVLFLRTPAKVENFSLGRWRKIRNFLLEGKRFWESRCVPNINISGFQCRNGIVRFFHWKPLNCWKHFLFDLDRVNNACGYREIVLKDKIYQNWKQTGILALSGFRRKDQIKKVSFQLFTSLQKLWFEILNQEIKLAVLENFELEYREIVKNDNSL